MNMIIKQPIRNRINSFQFPINILTFPFLFSVGSHVHQDPGRARGTRHLLQRGSERCTPGEGGTPTDGTVPPGGHHRVEEENALPTPHSSGVGGGHQHDAHSLDHQDPGPVGGEQRFSILISAIIVL